MASGSDWWARQLGGVVPSTPAPSVQPIQTVSYPQKAVRWQPQYPPTGPRQEVVDDQPGGEGDDSWQRVHRQGFVSKAPTSLGRDGKCPGCGGSNYFRRKGPMGVEAAPLCTECGYNGEYFTQSGTLLNAVGMKSSGPTQFARTDNPEAQAHLWADPGLSSTEFSWSAVR